MRTMSSPDYVSRAMKDVLAMTGLVAESDSTVLLLGETGSGKDYLARSIHRSSRRKAGPYLPINCTGLPADLFESELFGHERGAFTSASERKIGLIEVAQGGTLFLNEIGEMPIQLQPKLLTFLDTRSFSRVGGTKPIRADVRIIAATNQELEDMVAAGVFRADLLFRLNVITIRVPALRERSEDIPMLAQGLLGRLAHAMPSQIIPELYQQTVDAMIRYPWPGNVRELGNILERCLVLAGGKTEEMNALIVEEIRNRSNRKPKAAAPPGEYDSPPIILEILQNAAGKRVRNPNTDQKKRLYEECILERHWTRKRLAHELGLSPSTVSKWFGGHRATNIRQLHEGDV